MKKRGNSFLYIGGGITAAMVALILVGFFWTPYNTTEMNAAAKFQAPSLQHLLGTDNFGRDIFSRVLEGAGTTFLIGICVVVIGCFFGILIGSLCGYYGGIPDLILTRICDSITAFPAILLGLVIISLIGGGTYNIIIALGILFIPSFARIMRSATLAVKGSLYVEVAQSLGCKDSRLLFVHIFPGTIQSLIVNFTMRIGSAIMAAASLSFLGFGANVSEPEWGAMLSQGRNYIGIASHMVYFPGLIIFITVLAFNLFGDGLRDTLDPKIK